MRIGPFHFFEWKALTHEQILEMLGGGVTVSADIALRVPAIAILEGARVGLVQENPEEAKGIGMMTPAELKSAGMISVEHGWIILRKGRRIEDQLYPSRNEADLPCPRYSPDFTSAQSKQRDKRRTSKLFNSTSSKIQANQATLQKENVRMEFPGRFFPVFDTLPNDEFIARWREHISSTGTPEEFENVSTTKPAQLENINLLSEEIAVPINLRLGEDRVPCPFCAPNSPKFIRGRMAYFPDEKAVRFIGHKCAQSHFGENFKHAEAVFRRQTRCRQYIDLWREIGPRYGDLAHFIDVMSKSAVDIQFVRDQLDSQATGFANFLHGELAQTRGELFVKLDLGIKDRNGNAVIQEKLIGTAAGLKFLSRGYDVDKGVRQIKSALCTVEVELPEWAPSSPEHPATAEILKRGRLVEKSIQRIPDLLADINDGLIFLRKKNLSLIHQWGNRMDTPFARFEVKSDDRQLQVRSNTFAGDHYANVLIHDAAKMAPVKSPDPVIQQLIRMVA